MTGENGVYNLWDHRVLVTHHAWEQSFATIQLTDQIGPELFFNGAISSQVIEKTAGAKLAQRPWQLGVRHEYKLAV